MRKLAFCSWCLLSVMAAACGGGDDAADDDVDADVPDASGPDAEPPCTPSTLNFSPGQEQEIQDAVNSLADCTTVKLSGGTYNFNNAITIRAKGITLEGVGKGLRGQSQGAAKPGGLPSATILSFTEAAANTNGLDVVGNDFTVKDLAVWNAKKDAVRIESSKRVKIQRVRTEWELADQASNGAYGLYPVKCEDVLMEDCEAYKASDAGIYVGQTVRAIIRNNVAKMNVAGIEIENTQHADVYGNTAEDNTCGLVVFDLPGNPISGTDILLKDNIVKNNNRANFASVSEASSTVSQVPAGTGTFIMASRRVEIVGNTYANNNSLDVSVLSGKQIDTNEANWNKDKNFASKDIWVHGNTFEGGSGDSVDNGATDKDLRPLGFLLATLYGGAAQAQLSDGVLEHVIWDGADPGFFTNDKLNGINLCVADNTAADNPSAMIGDTNLVFVFFEFEKAEPSIETAWGLTNHVAQGAAPFNCAGFTPALTPVVLP